MRAMRHKFVWLVVPVVAAGIAAAWLVTSRPAVTLSVISVQRTSGSTTARCELRNHGTRRIELTIHSLGHTPFYHRLQRPFLSWRGTRDLGLRKALSWQPVIWDTECGIDAEARILGAGETFPFTASVIDTSQQVRLAVSYRLDGADFTASSHTIRP
jgi:hypothetical protein